MDIVARRVDSEESMREALAGFDAEVILSDFSMPRFDGLSALRTAKIVAPDLRSSSYPERSARSARSRRSGWARRTTSSRTTSGG
jgi:Response regulator containing a CheY-like receiver domain and an HTH DNA-binding domain